MKHVNVNIGIAFPLFLIFLVLKLTEVITWSWWWVTAPLWISFAVIGVILFIVASIAIIVNIVEK